MPEQAKKPPVAEPWDVLDLEWGEVVSCVAVSAKPSEWPFRLGTCVMHANPLSAVIDLRVKYENGAMARISCRGFHALGGIGLPGEEIVFEGGEPRIEFGEVANEDASSAHTPSEPPTAETRVCGNRRLVATVLKALTSFDYIPAGKVELVSAEEADAIFASTGVSPAPLAFDAAYQSAKERGWMEKWRGEGLMCHDDPLTLAKVRATREAHAAVVKARGELVALCDGRVRYGKELSDAELEMLSDPRYPSYVPPSELMLESGWHQPIAI